MKYLASLHLHSTSNWILEPESSGYSYKIYNKNFNILYGNYGIRFYIKIDKGSQITIPASGNYTDERIDLNTTSKSLNIDKLDFMQVTHTVTNKG